MGEKEMEDRYYDLMAKLMGIRDVVARLVAYEALRSTEPKTVLEDFSDATGHRLYETQKRSGKKQSPQTIVLQETIQAEVDWIVAAARTSIEEGSAK